MFLKGRFNGAIAVILLLLLINPMLVKLLHRHDSEHRHCDKPTASGINRISDHHDTCEICSFDYVSVIISGSIKKSVPQSGFYIFLSFLKEKSSSFKVLYAPLRAPPLTS